MSIIIGVCVSGSNLIIKDKAGLMYWWGNRVTREHRIGTIRSFQSKPDNHFVDSTSNYLKEKGFSLEFTDVDVYLLLES